MITEALPVVLARGEANTLFAFCEEVIAHLGAAKIEGRFALWTEITPPGGGPPPLYHLKGKIGFFHDNRWRDVGPGPVVFMPRRSVHTFKNIGETPSRMIIQANPAEIEAFFARCAEEFAKAGGPDMQEFPLAG